MVEASEHKLTHFANLCDDEEDDLMLVMMMDDDYDVDIMMKTTIPMMILMMMVFVMCLSASWSCETNCTEFRAAVARTTQR